MVTFFLVNPTRSSSSISILVSFNGKKYRRSVGESVPVKMWNNTKKRAKVTADYTYGNVINDVLSKWESAALRTLSYFKEYYTPPISEVFFAQLDKEYYKDEATEEVKPLSFVDYIRRYIMRYNNTRSVSCIKKYTTTLNKISDYERELSIKIKFEDIDIDFYSSFKKWFYSKGYSTNYLDNIIKTLKQIYNEAKYVDNLHDFDKIKHKDFSGHREDSDNIYLTGCELALIHNLDLSAEYIIKFYETDDVYLDREQARKRSVSYNIIRDKFLIGAYTGLRVSDFNALKNENIQGNFIQIRTKKTDYHTVIPIKSALREILNRSDICIAVTDQKINKHIKEICRMAGIDSDVLMYKNEGGIRVKKMYKKWQLVCTHTARRSFATNAYKDRVPTIAIMKITGHTKESTFLKYIKVTSEENAEMLLSHDFFK